MVHCAQIAGTAFHEEGGQISRHSPEAALSRMAQTIAQMSFAMLGLQSRYLFIAKVSAN